MQDLTKKMVAKRDHIVNPITQEIGKSPADSRRGFDRTVDSITATINALTSIDNANSRFEIVEGTIGQGRRTPLGVPLCMRPYN